MQIKRDGRLARWAYWPDKGRDFVMPSQVSTCVLFWRVVLLTPALWLAAATMVVMLSPFWVPIWFADSIIQRRKDALGDAYVPLSKRVEARLESSIVAQTVLGFKRRVCPLIRLED